MKNLIGGLFRTQNDANLAYKALHRSGYSEEDINLLIHKPRSAVSRSTEVRVQEIAGHAFVGGLIGGVLGGFLGFLVGAGTISLPMLEPGSVTRDPLFLFMSIVWGLITGGLTGIILGAASRLLRSREKAEVMTQEIEERGVLVMVNVEDPQEETKVRHMLEELQAVEVGDAQETWDLGVWVDPNEHPVSVANAS